MAFKTVGQRGYGEQTAWNAVGTAKRIAPGRFLAESWSNAFVTTGGMYTFKHKGEGQIYSSRRLERHAARRMLQSARLGNRNRNPTVLIADDHAHRDRHRARF